MKSCSQFIKEAVETLASTEAKNRGLVGNGHGDWYDKQGNFVAKTVDGKLKFFGGGAGKDPSQIQKDTVFARRNKSAMQQNVQPPEEEQATEVKGACVLVGRFNPPSKFHEKMMKFGMDVANRKGYEYRIYPSRIEDGQTNPLNASEKISLMGFMFPDYADYIVDSDEIKTIFDILESLYNDGYTDVAIVVGQDRLGEFQSLVHKADGERYEFQNIEVIPAGVKDPDSEVETPGSSAMMRTAAAVGDYERFITGLPGKITRADKEEIFNIVRNSLDVNEDTEVWRIVPELDYDGLRWNYKNNGLYEVGTFVENLNSGLVGKIIRRGANYLICVTEDGIMFKSWLKDVREVYEIGTDEYRAHAQQMTPGQSVISYTGVHVNPTIKKRINKNSKKSLK